MKYKNTLWAVLATIALTVVACSPNPRRTLTQEEKLADFMWLTSKLESNYAPLEYKTKLHNFEYENLKENYRQQIAETQNNEDFYLVMKKFAAEMKDGHVNLVVNSSWLSGRSQVAYLGFRGHRKADNFLVTKFLPTFSSGSDYPVKIGDKITKFNGLSIKEAVDQIIKPYRNVGNAESNYTILSSLLFQRFSLSTPIPTEDFVTLEINRNEEILTVQVPWVIEDAAEHRQQQQRALQKKAEAAGIDFEAEVKKAEVLFGLAGSHPYVTDSFIKNTIKNLKGKINADEIIESILSLRVDQTFELKRDWDTHLGMEVLDSIEEKISGNKAKEPIDVLKAKRFVPSKAYAVPGAKIYPAYFTVQEINNERISIGYIWLNTFSPAARAKDVIKEFKSTLRFFRDLGGTGVQKLIIDLVGNGGGSLELGLKLGAALSSEPMLQPSIQFALNDSWVDNFQTRAENNVNDPAKEISRRTYQRMLRDLEKGLRLSHLSSMENMYPFQIVPNSDLVVQDQAFQFEIIALIDETCASMCDIFSSVLKDNEMAKFLGQKTMGAGGNVVNHFSAPNSGIFVSLTESLVVDSNGQYLENNGIEPDAEFTVSASKDSKYKALIEAAFEFAAN